MDEPDCSKAQPQFTSTTRFQLTKSEKFRPSILILPTAASTCRRFALSRTSSDNRTQYFSCKRCYYLTRKRPVGEIRFSVRLYLVDGVLYIPKDAEHHPECKPLASAAVEAQRIDRQMREEVLRGTTGAEEAFAKAVNMAALSHDEATVAELGTWNQRRHGYKRAMKRD